MALELNRERLERLLGAMVENLHGDWLLVGGALVALWLEPRRVTEDIDLVGLGSSPDDRLDLMRFADAMGLPIEAVNSAADYFVRRIPGWNEELELFRTGRQARIFRPSATLFLLLKMERLSDQDLFDCLAMMSLVRKDGLAIDIVTIIAALDNLTDTADASVLSRRATLRRELESWKASQSETRPSSD
jgi:hypothetical protein